VVSPKILVEPLETYRKMVLIRLSQEAIIREYHKDQIKTPVHLGIGLEGISVGVVQSLPPNTKSFGQLRNHGQYLAITGETDQFFGELYGKKTGMSGGKAGSMHIASPDYGLVSNSGIVGSTISLAVGAALAAKYRGNNGIAVAMFGDSAFEEGEFWESLNFACLHELRVLFVCEDNDIAVHTPGVDRRGFKSFSEAVKGFKCNVFEGDGTDVCSVIEVCSQAISSMLANPRPAFVSFRWFRFLEHVGPNTDFDIGYRSKPTESETLGFDPVHNYESLLISQGYAKETLDRIRRDVEIQIDQSISDAVAADYPGEEDMYLGVFS